MTRTRRLRHKYLLDTQIKLLERLSQRSPRAFLRCAEDIYLLSEGHGSEAIRNYYYPGFNNKDFKLLLEALKKISPNKKE